MNRARPAQIERARRLLAHERAVGSARQQSADESTAAGRVYDKLHAQLAPLVGAAGVHLLFMRSAKLAQGELAWLAEIPIVEGPTKLREFLHAREPVVATESAAALFGTFFTLLTICIGERLTNRVLGSAWPTIEGAAPEETDR
ncbi:hypothetical protein BH09MYX1_BH09MYX1_28120 [soil metagenome]